MFKCNVSNVLQSIQRIFKGQCYVGETKNFIQYHSGGDDYNPPKDCKMLADFIGDDKKNGVIYLYQDNVNRISKSGEKRFYSTDESGSVVVAQIYLENDGKLHIVSDADLEITSKSIVKINAPSISLGDGGLPIARQGDEITTADGKKGTITGGGINRSV